MARYIDADALYEMTAEWEASALAIIEMLNRTPLEKMDEDEKAELRWWTAILEGRSAFKHDVADAPTADVVERKKGKWKPFDRTWGRSIYHCTACGEAEDCPTEMGKVIWRFCPNCGAEMEVNDGET